MGVLSRFGNIMSCNVKSLLGKFKNPEKDIMKYLRVLEADLNSVKAETNAVRAIEQKARRELDECELNISKYERYAKKALETGDERGAKVYLSKKVDVIPQYNSLKAKYELAKDSSEKMNQLHDKLVQDTEMLRRALEEAKAQVRANSKETQKMETTVNQIQANAERAKYEKEALDELNNMQNSSVTSDAELDAEFAALLGEDNSANSNTSENSSAVDAELEAMRKELGL